MKHELIINAFAYIVLILVIKYPGFFTTYGFGIGRDGMKPWNSNSGIARFNKNTAKVAIFFLIIMDLVWGIIKFGINVIIIYALSLLILIILIYKKKGAKYCRAQIFSWLPSMALSIFILILFYVFN